jgi:hypothetical protein
MYGVPLVQVQQGRQRLGRRHPVRSVVAEARHHPRLVVVVPVEAVPADVRESSLPAAQRRLEREQVERSGVELVDAGVELHVLELEHHVDLATLRVGEQPRLVHRRSRHLADGEEGTLPPGEHLAVHLGEELVDAGPGHHVDGAVAQRAVTEHRAVRQCRVLGDEVDDVHAEAVDPRSSHQRIIEYTPRVRRGSPSSGPAACG